MEKDKKVFVTGTRDRLFIAQSSYESRWLLVDRRGNVYDSSPSPDVIIKHIDDFVEQGKYTLK